MVRSNRGEKLLERARRRHGTSWPRPARDQVRDDVAAVQARTAAQVAEAVEPPTEPHGEADPSLDVALYNCSCGLVFEAPVSTSVDCPHCGGSLAW